MSHLLDLVRSNGAATGTRGHHGGGRGKRMAGLAASAQSGLCWLCGEPFTEGDPAQADRLVTGADLGVCSLPEAPCQGRQDCRCGYVEGNIGAAHRDCHVGVRQSLSDATVLALAQRYVPTAGEMAAATVRSERSERGRRIARRTALAQERA